MTFIKTIEEIQKKQQKEMQWLLLKRILIEAGNKSKFYKNWFTKHNINPYEINNFKDFEKLPLMDKFHVLENNPFDFMICENKDLLAVFSSGGTSGKSKFIFDDKESLDFFIKKEGRRTFEHIGITKHDRIALLNTMGIAAAGSKLLATTIDYGAMVIPIGSGLGAEFTAEIMKTLKATVYWSSAVFATALTKKIIEMGMDPKKDFFIKKIICSGMPLPDNTRNFLKEKWGAEVFMAAGATEFGMLGHECREHNGMHISPEMMYWEILNPETGKTVEEGKIGEAVCTSLGKYAFPLFRYKLDDLVKISYQKCTCGSLRPRIWIVGRTHETIFIGAHKVYGFQIDYALKNINGISGNYQLRIKEDGQKTILCYKIETLNPELTNSAQLKIITKEKLEQLSATFFLGVREGRFEVNLEFVEPNILPRTTRDKVKDKVVDEREVKNKH